ncbi:hypothetical protein IW150_005955 [Coemansia sp. RSA 2607]|nr:hypothetical protein IW150_005955 [Coemansia sp. RSA 2607]
MGGQMMGGGGPMMGPYGMGNDQWGGPMYNMPGGEGNSHYHSGRARGQRYNAHAGVDEWPIPKNPYMNARWNKHSNHAQLYANDGQMGMGGPMMGPSGHNRIPMDEGADKDDADSDNDDDADSSKSSNKDSSSSATAADNSGDIRVGGVNRISASADGSNPLLGADASDTNTSINMAAMSDRILNVNAFDGASIKPTATANSQTSASSNAPLTSSTGPSRQTITRSLNTVKPTHKPESVDHKANAHTRVASLQRCTSSSIVRPLAETTCTHAAAASAAATVATTCTHTTAGAAIPAAKKTASAKKPAKPSATATATATKRPRPQVKTDSASTTCSHVRASASTSVPGKKEPSMKNVRGL